MFLPVNRGTTELARVDYDDDNYRNLNISFISFILIKNNVTLDMAYHRHSL